METELVARKGPSALCWEKLLEEAPWAVACDLKQGAVSQCEAVERALDSGSWVLGSISPQQSVISPTKRAPTFYKNHPVTSPGHPRAQAPASESIVWS